MKSFCLRRWPLLLIIIIWLIFTYPFWLSHLIPAPLDFLVTFFGPWQGSFNIPVKNPAIPDVVNQIIPWKIFTIDQWRQGIVPLWNPYSLTGAPHAANWQSAVFYPFNALMLLFGFIKGWSLYVIAQPLLAGLFTYFYTRSLKLSRAAALFSSLSFMFSGFLTSWLEWGTLGHALLWLPASLWSIEKFFATKSVKFILLNSIFLSSSLLAGHLQISLYVIAVSLAYFLYFSKRTVLARTVLKGTVLIFLPFLLTAFQVLPSIELYFHSLRSSSFSPGWFEFFRIPLQYLTTFIAPDFFGNPVTRNQWGSGSYVEMMGYVGLIPLIFAVYAISHRSKINKFFSILILVSLSLSLKTPLANLILWLKIPVLASSSPARIIGLVSFSLSILAGFGFDQIVKPNTTSRHRAIFRWFIAGFSGVIAGLWIVAFALRQPVAQRNLIVPTVILLILVTGLSLIKKRLFLATCFLLLVTAADLFRFHHKFVPYSNSQYFYPSFGLRFKLDQLNNIDRTFGLFDANLNLPFKIYSVEGYDPLLTKSYLELTSSHKDGTVSLPDRAASVEIGKNEPFTIPLLNLLSAKYFVQPTIHGAAPWELRLWEYPGQFEMLYDSGKQQLFLNSQAIPRYFLAKLNPEHFNNQDNIISLFNQPLKPSPNLGKITLLNYQANKVEFVVDAKSPSLLYLGDSIYPGWQVTLDGQGEKLLRANYNFRAVSIPQGNHQVTFSYNPKSFRVGLLISALTLITGLIYYKKYAT